MIVYSVTTERAFDSWVKFYDVKAERVLAQVNGESLLFHITPCATHDRLFLNNIVCDIDFDAALTADKMINI